MGIKRQARECALQIVFQLDGVAQPGSADVDDAIARFFENFDSPDDKGIFLAITSATAGARRSGMRAPASKGISSMPSVRAPCACAMRCRWKASTADAGALARLRGRPSARRAMACSSWRALW